MKSIVCSLLAALLALGAQAQPTDSSAVREVAVTFDDLPVNGIAPAAFGAITEKLVAAITRNDVPAIGFVNEMKLYPDDTLDAARVAMLQAWLDAGLDLGNHTYSHRSLNRIPRADYQDDVLRGERVTRPLVEKAGKELQYFRHPFLHTGRSVAKRDSFYAFLAAHEYTVAPVTIDNSEWIFARAYDHAAARNDSAMMGRIADEYLRYMDAKFAFFERQEQDFLERRMKHVLLLHANRLNADTFDALATVIRARSYRFISLEEALTDPAYALPDTYAGPVGLSWLQRWAFTAGLEGDFFRGEPRTPAFVMEEAGVDQE